MNKTMTQLGVTTYLAIHILGSVRVANIEKYRCIRHNIITNLFLLTSY